VGTCLFLFVSGFLSAGCVLAFALISLRGCVHVRFFIICLPPRLYLSLYQFAVSSWLLFCCQLFLIGCAVNPRLCKYFFLSSSVSLNLLLVCYINKGAFFVLLVNLIIVFIVSCVITYHLVTSIPYRRE